MVFIKITASKASLIAIAYTNIGKCHLIKGQQVGSMTVRRTTGICCCCLGINVLDASGSDHSDRYDKVHRLDNLTDHRIHDIRALDVVEGS